MIAPVDDDGGDEMFTPRLRDIPMGSVWGHEVLLDQATGRLFTALDRATFWPDESLYWTDAFPEWTIPLLVEAIARQFDGDVELREVTAPRWYADQPHNPHLDAQVIDANVSGGTFLPVRMRGRWATIPGEGSQPSRRVVAIEADLADGTVETLVIPTEEINQVIAAVVLWMVKMVRPA
jgi:hypothetical protein